MGKKPFHLRELAKTSGQAAPASRQQKKLPVPIIINEYDWLWLNRDGTPDLPDRQGLREPAGAELDGRAAAACSTPATWPR